MKKEPFELSHTPFDFTWAEMLAYWELVIHHFGIGTIDASRAVDRLDAAQVMLCEWPGPIPAQLAQDVADLVITHWSELPEWDRVLAPGVLALTCLDAARTFLERRRSFESPRVVKAIDRVLKTWELGPDPGPAGPRASSSRDTDRE